MGGRRLSVLDSPGHLASVGGDTALAAVASLPDQVSKAAATAESVPAGRLPDPGRVRSVLFCGMGGSAVGGDVVAAVAASSGRAPVVVHRGYSVPAWCSADTFVVASSYSGSTEETLDAFRAARDAGARGVAVTCGGPLAEEADAAGWAVASPEEGLMPRYALGWMTALPAAVCERAGLLRLAAGWADALPIALSRRVSMWGAGAPAQDNVAKGLAHALAGAFPVIWGGEPASAAAALRWKNDLNENAKTFAHAAALPEADHNEIVGWAPEGADGRPPVRRVLVCLRESVEEARVAARFEATTREVAGDFEVVAEATGEGDDPMQRFFDLALLGGFVSCYLAVLRGVDPTPIPSITRLKHALAQTGD